MPFRRYVFGVLAGVLLLLVAAAVAVDWAGRRTGSTLTPSEVADAQSENSRIVYFVEQIPGWGSIKLAGAARTAPEVIYVGSSRGNSLRSQMFAPYRFYNAALTAWTIEQTRLMVQKILDVSSPKMILFSLDYWMFTNQWSGIEKTRSMQFRWLLNYKLRSNQLFLDSMLKGWPVLFPKVMPLLFGQPIDQGQSPIFLGVDAIWHEVGFRSDGSFHQFSEIRAAANDSDKQSMGSVLNAFPGGEHADNDQLAALERLADLARSKGVQLVAVQFPIAKSARDFLDTNEDYRGNAGVWRESQTNERRAYLDRLGIPFFDLSRLSDDNTDFQDAAHITEKGSIKALLALYEDPRFRKFLPRLKVERLGEDLERNRSSEFVTIFGTH